MKRRAQVTIFVIIAVVIIAIVGLFFLIRSEKSPFVPGKIETNPRAFMESCVEEQMRENINLVLSQGGFIEPLNYHDFYDGEKDNKVAYLCYTNGKLACVNQHPMLLSEISNELKKSIELKVEECFNDFKSSLEKQGYEITLGENIETKIILTLGKVYLDIKRDLSVIRNEDTSSIKEMRLTYSSSLYNLASIANKIVNAEAQYCYFEPMGYTALYPNYLVLLKRMSDSTKIYYIKDKKTQEQLNIAIKGCA